jgi:hypothetical protein
VSIPWVIITIIPKKLDLFILLEANTVGVTYIPLLPSVLGDISGVMFLLECIFLQFMPFRACYAYHSDL